MSVPSPDVVAKRITRCRLCGGDTLTELFSLGEQYVSDFVAPELATTGHKVPIELVLCPSCTLVQQRYTAQQDFMYTRHYWYRSGVTQTMRDALRDVVDSAYRYALLKAGDTVLDIGSNDGTLLRFYHPDLVRVGVEPAKNMQTYYKGTGEPVLIPEFWGHEAYERSVPMHSSIMHKDGALKPKVITALGMFYDLDDPNQFIADVAAVLHPEGVFIAQLMCLKQTVQQADVGNFCHEHLEFYSLFSLAYLFRKHGLDIYDIEENGVNGGSYRLYICHQGVKKSKDIFRWNVYDSFRAEDDMRLAEPATYRRLHADMATNRNECLGFIYNAVKRRNKTVWIYGASTKGNVIAQWYTLDRDLIQAACDKSPEKWGKVMVGTGIPIRSNEEFRAARPDYALVMPYAFVYEFVELESEWRSQGGKFIVPLPNFRVI